MAYAVKLSTIVIYYFGIFTFFKFAWGWDQTLDLSVHFLLIFSNFTAELHRLALRLVSTLFWYRIKLARLYKRKKIIALFKTHQFNAKSASEIGRVNEPLEMMS